MDLHYAPLKQTKVRFCREAEGHSIKVGQDFLFWFYFTQCLKRLLLKDQYIPSLRYQEVGSKKKEAYQIYPGWEFLSDSYLRLLAQAQECMPASAAPGFEAHSILKHCAETLLNSACDQAKITQALQKQIEGTFVAAALGPKHSSAWKRTSNLRLQQQWAAWRRRVAEGEGDSGFQLALQLYEPPGDQPDPWRLEFRLISRADPSLQIPLAEYWRFKDRERAAWLNNFGINKAQNASESFEQALLLQLGQAARIHPALWQTLETDKPAEISLSLEEAFAFLTETAWILEDAGYRVIVPSWWTPRGRRRAKLRMRSPNSGPKAKAAAKENVLSLDEIIQYHYELTLGDTVLNPQEWEQLVASKTPLVQFRGEWVVLDRERMSEMLAFWKQQGETGENLDIQGLLRRTAEEADSFEIDPEDALAAMLEKLRDPSRIEAANEPPGLQARLREYQKRGVAWLNYLEGMGLSGCLADDMGLGKTIPRSSLCCLPSAHRIRAPRSSRQARSKHPRC